MMLRFVCDVLSASTITAHGNNPHTEDNTKSIQNVVFPVFLVELQCAMNV
jgi:hypothetical protein